MFVRRPSDTVAGRFLRSLGYGAYFRATAFNYEHRLFARPNRTPAGRFRCYELLNRHGSDAMLAAVEANCGPDDIIYDVGANVGIYSLALAANEPNRQLFAFEPSPPAVERCVANIACNRFGDRIELHAYGLGEERGERQFYRSTYPELSGFDRESATRWEARIREIHTIPVRPLDELDLPPPDLLKLDVEGAGPAVVRGGYELLRETAPTVVIEIHEAGLPGRRSKQLQPVFEQLDYEITKRDGYWLCEPR